MLTINKIHKSYGKNFTLDIENLDLSDTGVVALLGPNGSGKTTMLKILLGLVKPKIGDVTWSGDSIFSGYSFRNNLSYMPQTAIYPQNLKVEEILDIIKSLKPEITQYDTELFSTFGLDAKLGSKFSSLSQGTKQKIAAAVVFMFRSNIIILDEPSAGLDPYASAMLKQKILKEKKSRLILFTTHIISDVLDLADRFLFLYEGVLTLDRAVTHDDLKNGNIEFVKEISSYFKH
ncbi:MAG: ABC transporter ATP-binding protein [Ignavibacteria bacterium]|nr:ABC transporter ATP-binding protein [Ignavibacteria bacterium]